MKKIVINLLTFLFGTSSFNSTCKKVVSKSMVVFLLISVTSCGIGNEKTLSTNGSLEVESRIFEFGDIVKEGDMKKPFYFDVTNKSDTLIEIKQIDVSCGCVTIDEYPEIVNPRSSIKLRGYMDLRREDGFFEKSIYVNYKKDKLLLLRVMGEVKNINNN